MNTQKKGGPTAGTTLSNTTNFSDQSTRRRTAAARCEPLECGCRDPWTCRCRTIEPTTEAAIQAAEHLLQNGLQPLFSVAQGRALWRAGRRDLATLCVQQVVA